MTFDKNNSLSNTKQFNFEKEDKVKTVKTIIYLPISIKRFILEGETNSLIHYIFKNCYKRLQMR